MANPSGGKRMNGKEVNKRWIITRYIIEEFEIYAKNRKEAVENVDDPYSITVRKETCILQKDQKK